MELSSSASCPAIVSGRLLAHLPPRLALVANHNIRIDSQRRWFSYSAGANFQNVSDINDNFCKYKKGKIKSHPTRREIAAHSEVYFCSDAINPCLPFQTLNSFPKEELLGKVVMVRFDSKACPMDDQFGFQYTNENALNTLRYLCNAGSKVVIATHWVMSKSSSRFVPPQSIADHLSVYLGMKIAVANGVIGDEVKHSIDKLQNGDIMLLGNLSHYKEEAANCTDFARNLSARIDILVNDSFSDSHRVLASTVGIARFTYARIAGFHLAYMISLLTETLGNPKRPFTAIIGGANILEKSNAIRSLLCKCNKLVFIGTMSFTFLSALGMPVSPNFVEKRAHQQALELLDIAKQRKVTVLLPKDFWCINETCSSGDLQVFEPHCIMDGWRPIDIGPESLNELVSVLKTCKTALWIGPVRIWPSKHQDHRSLHLSTLLNQVSETGCTSIAIGKEACDLVKETSKSCAVRPIFKHGAAVWEFLKGNTLAGVAALDHAFYSKFAWRDIFQNPSQPLVVDIGSGNGLFALRMAGMYENVNIIGLEINSKLVDRSLACVQERGLRNVYFVSANATSSFRFIVSSYPGPLYLVCIQCPNPDFVDRGHRWRMVQRSLVEAIVELICEDGKIFLQSDVKEVAVRMKDEFLQHGNGKVAMSTEHRDSKQCTVEGWLKNNPFSVFSDWEQHVIASGRPMYRIMLSKCIDFEQTGIYYSLEETPNK